MLRKFVPSPFIEFFRVEAASGVLLFTVTLAALIWANSPFEGHYHSMWGISVGRMSLHHWINDGLMVLFFLVVGLEIKREIVSGELSSWQKAALPFASACGGMIVPAVIYMIVNWKQEGATGWGIPMATDIAFAIGVLALLGQRVPLALKVFLLALAIVDDMGAVLIIALFYAHAVSWVILVCGIAIFGVLLILNYTRLTNFWSYLIGGILLWFAFLESGVHPTVAGVLLAIAVPSAIGPTFEERLHPWVTFGVMPLFAFTNAGVSVSGGDVTHPVSLGTILGLVLGKQIGITLFAWLAVQFGFAALPKSVGWIHIYAIGCLAGIGFTMSLFIASLAFGASALNDIAKVGILIASALSAIAGAAILHGGLRFKTV